jgi:hypothetical protein
MRDHLVIRGRDGDPGPALRVGCALGEVPACVGVVVADHQLAAPACAVPAGAFDAELAARDHAEVHARQFLGLAELDITVFQRGHQRLRIASCLRIGLDTPDEFAKWDEPGTVRVLFGHWVEETPDGSALVSEARVQPVDGSASLRLRALWKVIGPFERLVGAEALARATERSQRG